MVLRELHPGADASSGAGRAETDAGNYGPTQTGRCLLWEERVQGAKDHLLWLLSQCCKKGMLHLSPYSLFSGYPTALAWLPNESGKLGKEPMSPS